MAHTESEIIRYAALLRGTESAWQALSYGLGSLTVWADVGGVYFNFGLWAIAIFPAWLVIRHFGSRKEELELSPAARVDADTLETPPSEEIGHDKLS